jgi:carboxymethylenebutenolidase
MGKKFQLTTSDGVSIGAYRADPADKPKAGLVVVQEVFGVNQHVRRVCDYYASQGYLAVAPAVMDRMVPGFETDDYSPATFTKVREIMADFKPDLALLDIAAAVKVAAAAGKVGIVGYCLGGMLAWRAAHAGLGLSAASGYYGGGIPGYIDLAPTIPIIMHYGEKDTGIPLDQVEQLRAKYPDVPIYLYDAAHGFNCDERGSHDAEAAALARKRTLDFFAENLA